MSGLPRELLKWLQSLDLSYSVKNVRRDFANGFLIAEIFSRYYQSDVEMHSYDNGQALARKLDNWAQLSKFFQKKGIRVERTLIDDVVHCKSAEAPSQLIQIIYSQLTGRTIRAPVNPAADPTATMGGDPSSELPPFARPNAATLLSSKMKESEMATTLTDQKAAQARAKAILDEHSEALRQERTSEPNRFQTASGYMGSNASQRLLRGEPKPLSQATESQSVRFQEVRVKPVERNIAQLRASRDASHQASQYGSVGGGSAEAPGFPADGQAVAYEAVGRDVLRALSDLVLADEQLGGGALAAADAPTPYHGLLKVMPQLPPAAVAALFDRAVADADALAQACSASPKQCWQLFHSLCAAMSAAESAEVFSAAAALLSAVGRALAAADAALAESLLRDFGLPQLLPMLGSQPGRMRELLMVVYSFAAETPAAHVGVIRALQEALGQQQPFLLALTRRAMSHMCLVGLEGSFSDDLLDLYVYYCVIGLSMTSCRLRAASLSMLPTLAASGAQGVAVVLQMLPRLAELADDPWWEVQAQLGKLCATLLPLAPADAAPKLSALLSGVLANRCPSAMSLALSSTAPLLAASPELLPPFVSCLLAVPAPQRALLLSSTGAAVPLPIVSSVAYALRPLPAAWAPLQVAQALLADAKAQQLSYLEPAHADVLGALLAAPHPPAEADEWAAFMLAGKEYLYVALCDEDLCAPIADALLALFGFLQEGALKTFSTLLSSMRMIFPDGPAPCQATALAFLVRLFELGEPFSGAVYNLVSNFDEALRTSQLSTLVARVEAEYKPPQ